MSESPRLEELRRRVQADPASIAFAALAEEYRRASRFKDAVETSRAGLRHHPTYVSARVTLGRSLVELQEFDQAERELAFVLKSAPDNLAARRALGELCWQKMRFADALEHFRAAMQLAPNDTELPGIVASLEREVEAERLAVEATSKAAETALAAREAEAEGEPDADVSSSADAARTDDTAVLAHAAPSVYGAASTNGTSGSKVLASLERFYRAIVRARADRGVTQPGA